MTRVEVISYTKDWVNAFNEESEEIKAIFGALILEFHHIGSTTVPGMAAKPIIDMMPVVSDIEQVDRFNDEMIKLGYVPMGENGIPGRRYFQKGGDQRTHHVHIYEKGNAEIERHLAFRDYMMAHPEEAKKYSELKLTLAKQFPTDIESYINGKDAFIKDIDDKAAIWRKNNGAPQ
ncbi:MAG: GrpB family protein [Tuberibacillus sp.]